MEMRCDHKLHGVVEDGVIEVKCGSSLCGKRPGVVVIHRFNALTGELVGTKLYKDTPIIKKEKVNVSK
jgi:hypothetical protein